MAAAYEPVSQDWRERLVQLFAEVLTEARQRIEDDEVYGTDDPGYRMALDVQYHRSQLHLVREAS